MPTAVEYLLTIDNLVMQAPFESYSFGVENSANIGSQSSGSGAGKVTFNPFTITRKIDKASPTLFQACVTGQHIKTATLQLLPAVQKGVPAPPALTFVLSDVIISAIREAGNVHGGITPLEEVAFQFRIFKITVDGNSFSYDIKRGETI